MAQQQQPNRDDFGNDPKTHVDVRDRDRNHDRDSDVCKNEEFGSRTGADPVSNYGYGSRERGEFGGAPYGTGYEYTSAYGTTDAVPPYADPVGFGSGAAAGFGNAGSDAGAGAGQWGRKANVDRGDSRRNRNRNVNLAGRDNN